MRISKQLLIVPVCAVLLLSMLTPLLRSLAQSNDVTITIGVPNFIRETIEERAIKDFEAANPGIKVQVVSQDTLGAVQPSSSIDAHLDAVQKLASTADLVFVQGNAVSPMATRAGYFLNLQPLIDSDKTLNPEDFQPTLWKSYQWDNSFWALPLAATPIVLTYDPAAFDKVGLTYPTDNWTLDELIAAVKALNQKDAQGQITAAGIELYPGTNDIPLFMSVLGRPLVDTNAIPNPPQIDTPETISLLEKLKDLQALLPLQQADFNTAPIRIESIFNLSFRRPGEIPRRGVLLPGGHSYLDVTGLAISGASQHPEQAYTLAKFLSGRAEVLRFNSIPARLSVAANQGGIAQQIGNLLNPELTALQDKSVKTGLSTADRRFYDYLSTVTIKMRTENLDGRSASELAQSSASKDQQVALDRKTDGARVAVVATPIPPVDPSKGITLKFGITTFTPQLARRNEINTLAAEFVRNTNGVARVDIQTGFQRAEQSADKYDCFYLPYSAVPSIQLDRVLPLDPFLTSDPNFDTSNYIGGSIAQVSRDGKVWALPMGITPTVMWYDPTVFANAGLPPPQYGWNITSFKDSLTALKPRIKDNKPPFHMEGAGGAGVSLLMLMASYGGFPIDWSTNPPTVRLTDPANLDAQRQVLDLAKAGLIDYQQLGSTFGILNRGRPVDNPLYSQQLNGLNFRALALAAPQNTQQEDTSRFVAITFPRGSGKQALSYSSGSLYISSKAQNPDACYKWISAFASHPDLLDLMPVQKTSLVDPALESRIGKSLANVYRDVAKILEEPETLKVPSLFDGGSNIAGFVVQYWLFEAWDSYVLKNGDLDTVMKDAQVYVDAYQTCQAGVPAFDPAQQKYEDYIQQVITCATKADPRLKALLGQR